jgi:poly(hydroxyalkanoate) depolymerase family esterase
MKRNDKVVAAARDFARTEPNRLSPESVPDFFAGVDSAWPYKAPVLDSESDTKSGVKRIGARAAEEGEFIEGTYTNHAGKRSYKLYTPSAYHGQALPLIVMLHGCSQDPDDFAAGTQMNTIAEEKNCFVLYPAQAESANGSRCWNWFKALNQRRNVGEPSIIAGMTRDIIKTCHIDTDKVFIAGLSSGGAMAAIMGATYPDLYAAVGIHSGMPYASARNWSSAIITMRNGNGNGNDKGEPGQAVRPAFFGRRKAVPIIVFHGDRDTTVHPSNGDQIIAQSISIAAHRSMVPENEAFPHITIGQGKVSNGRSYTHAVHRDNHGRIIAEQWIVHGTGHAWSGGSRLGSFTDSKGPDAGREMLRFFLTHAE